MVAVLGGTTAAAFLVQLPYYVVQPGSVRSADDRVDILGNTDDDPEGEVFFTTVYLHQATPALLTRAWLDDAAEIRTPEEMYPDGDREGQRRLNRQRMDLSKLVATRVALEYLGIDAEYDSDGTRVLGVAPASPSADVLRPDDVIVEVDGGGIGMPSDIAEELSGRQPGETVDVLVRRQGEDDVVEERLSVELAADPDDPGRPMLGIEAEPASPVVRSEVDVAVDSGEVSGPSAGLAWTLTIIDRLSPGSLTQGRAVAVTGEIRDDGSVGEVGGVAQKTAAVKRRGVDVFIFPADTPDEVQQEMRRIAGDDLELRPVATLDDAVEALAPDGIERPA